MNPVLAVLLLHALACTAVAADRVALVIGNSHYGGDLGLLPNPVNDAKLIAQTLRKVGFDVVEVEDADQQAMKKAIVGMVMTVDSIEGSFKLNQHKSDADYTALVDALAVQPDNDAHVIAGLMRDARPQAFAANPDSTISSERNAQ